MREKDSAVSIDNIVSPRVSSHGGYSGRATLISLCDGHGRFATSSIGNPL